MLLLSYSWTLLDRSFLCESELFHTDRQQIFEFLTINFQNPKFIPESVAPFDNPLFHNIVLSDSIFGLFFLTKNQLILVLFHSLVILFWDLVKFSILRKNIVSLLFGFIYSFFHLLKLGFQISNLFNCNIINGVLFLHLF